MHKLVSGVHNFKTEQWSPTRDLVARLARAGQDPLALFIGCCDSRVVPTMITNSRPGDLFELRNIGNLVPNQDEAHIASVGAAVEYAVGVLEVTDIIVCGHSDCGAMKALCAGVDKLEPGTYLREWLALGEDTIALVRKEYPNLEGAELLETLAEENVLVQIEHLRSYPSVRKAMEQGKLHVHAWYFDLAEAAVFRYSTETEQYEKL